MKKPMLLFFASFFLFQLNAQNFVGKKKDIQNIMKNI